jgi:hypothetical protein
MSHPATDVPRLELCISAAKVRHRRDVAASERSELQVELGDLLSRAHNTREDDRDCLLSQADLADKAVRQRQVRLEDLSSELLLTELFIAGVACGPLTPAEPESAD